MKTLASLRRPALALLVVCSGIAVAAPPARAQDVVVRRLGADSVSVEPAGRANIVFRISGAMPRAQRVEVRAIAPLGWSVIEPAALELTRDSSALRVLGFVVPADAAPGRHVLVLTAGTGVGSAARDSVIVYVPARALVSLRSVDAPGWVSAGSSYRARFVLRNSGNVAVAAVLRASASGGARVDALPQSWPLEPGDETEIEAGIRAPHLLTAAAHVIRITAHTPTDTATAAVRVQVVPDGVAGAAQRHALRGALRVRLGDDARAGPPLRLYLSGPLRAGGDARVDLLLQGPVSGYSVFGEADTYRLALSTTNASLRLGDQFYALSPLTEPGREGVGGAASIRAGPVTTGAYMQSGRRIPDAASQLAVFARLRPVVPLTLGLNWLRTDEAGSAEHDMWSAQSGLRLGGGRLTADVEYARRAGSAADAHSIDVRLTEGAVAARVRHVRADRALGTSIGGSAVDALQLTLRPWRKLQLDAVAEESRIARCYGAGGNQLSEQQSARLSVAWSAALMLEARYAAALSTSGIAVVDREARSLRARLRVPLGALVVLPTFEAGRHLDRSLDREGGFWRAGANASLKTSLGAVSGSMEYSAGGSLHSSTAADGLAAAWSATLFPRSATRVGFAVGRTEYFGELGRSTSYGDASIEHDLPHGHRVALRALTRDWAGAYVANETRYMLDYTVPLRVPIGAGSTQSRVSGRIYDSETGAALQGALIEVGGRRTASDAQGHFEVRGLAAGPHAITLHAVAPGSGRVPVEALRAVSATSGAAGGRIDVALVRSAALAISATIARAGTRGDPLPPEPLAGVVIELHRNGERIRITTDEHGRALLPELRPGRWTVTVVAARLPSFHRFDFDTLNVELAPGGRDSLELRAVPVERRVRMITMDDAAVVAAAAPPASHVIPAPAERPTAPTPSRATRAPRAPLPVPPKSAGLRPGWTTVTVPAHITSLRGIARVAYRETGLWPKIWLANRDRLRNPDNVPAGTVLRLPPAAPLTEVEEAVLHEFMQFRPR